MFVFILHLVFFFMSRPTTIPMLDFFFLSYLIPLRLDPSLAAAFLLGKKGDVCGSTPCTVRLSLGASWILLLRRSLALTW
jgi:hypothetical protein